MTHNAFQLGNSLCNQINPRPGGPHWAGERKDFLLSQSIAAKKKAFFLLSSSCSRQPGGTQEATRAVCRISNRQRCRRPGPAEGGGDTNCIRPLVNSRKTNSGQIFGRSGRNVFVQEAAESASRSTGTGPCLISLKTSWLGKKQNQTKKKKTTTHKHVNTAPTALVGGISKKEKGKKTNHFFKKKKKVTDK